MRRWYRRHGPLGAGARLALLLAGSLLAVLVVVSLLHPDDEELQARWLAPLAQQLDALAGLLERTPEREHPPVLAALSGPLLPASLSAAPAVSDDPGWGPQRPLREGLRRQLAGRAPVVGWLPAGEHGPPRRLAVALRLSDGRWLNVTLPPRWYRPPGRWPWLLTTVVAVLAFALWAGHRFTRPLRRFAAAVERFGVDADLAPLAEEGPRELRQAMAAFNRMQARLKRLLDDRTRMLVALSHDLRTMLTRLKLRAEYIADETQQRKALADLDTMQAMLGAILDFARSEYGSDAAEARTRLDLADLLQSVCEQAEDRGEEARYRGPQHQVMAGQPLALRRAFANLVDNAVKYGGAAEVSLHPAAGTLMVWVEDRGPGIPPELRERVFDPFFRGEPARGLDAGGTGLGLTLARTTVRRHGGDIRLEERPGGGLRVVVVLPAAGTMAGG